MAHEISAASDPPASSRLHVVRIAVKLILLLWAGFWTWFVLMSAYDSGWAAAPHAAKILVPLLGFTAASWLWPRVSGGLLMLGGIFALSFFHNVYAQLMLAAPAIVVGLALVTVPPPAARHSVPARVVDTTS